MWLKQKYVDIYALCWYVIAGHLLFPYCRHFSRFRNLAAHNYSHSGPTAWTLSLWTLQSMNFFSTKSGKPCTELYHWKPINVFIYFWFWVQCHGWLFNNYSSMIFFNSLLITAFTATFWSRKEKHSQQDRKEWASIQFFNSTQFNLVQHL